MQNWRRAVCRGSCIPAVSQHGRELTGSKVRVCVWTRRPGVLWWSLWYQRITPSPSQRGSPGTSPSSPARPCRGQQGWLCPPPLRRWWDGREGPPAHTAHTLQAYPAQLCKHQPARQLVAAALLLINLKTLKLRAWRLQGSLWSLKQLILPLCALSSWQILPPSSPISVSEHSKAPTDWQRRQRNELSCTIAAASRNLQRCGTVVPAARELSMLQIPRSSQNTD